MLEKKRVQQLDIPSREGYDAIFNSNFLEDVPAALAQWGSSRVLLVSSKTLAAQHGDRIAALQSALGSHRLANTKLGVGSHSPYADVRDIARRVQRLRADCVISVGGCSYSDACKAACLLAANLAPDFTEEDMEALVDERRGIADARPEDGTPLRPRACRLVAVPTSLSAGEWNALSSATNARTGKKQHFGGWEGGGQPDLILLDPELAAATSPERLWLSSGVRCVDHCVELMCNPESAEGRCEGLHGHAERGLRCMLGGLTEYKAAKTRARGAGEKQQQQQGTQEEKEEAGDKERQLLLEGVSECQYGSREALTGLLIWRVPMGPSHAIGHQLGAVANVMHGVRLLATPSPSPHSRALISFKTRPVSNLTLPPLQITSCVMLAPVLRWQAANLSNPHYKTAQAKTLAIFNETLGWREASAADAVERFVRSLGLPTTLRDVGVVSDEEVRRIADKTMTDVWGGGKRQMEFDDVMEVLNSVRG
ncbi:hypothetical protein JDV02_004834 [Purpureocillium takamizusanense]|uniref:Alcohol dehydrogenase iron-type/glycerol dehydrogenase GldA domain-containing protein n=1 Tax=Purpureocillium takamizusanense TaxID=2060973 RepID=A0A9Q8VB63_9HYPO|nr:uncharacterized protein JDV02_004834 [Purpureocillium takamizusanense]UNI18576.1 hypothetical protein JDV02_004834 [Purpureocillium takamizusanense]